MTRMLGTVKFYNADKGFGFIVPQDGAKDMFFHVSECSPEGWIPAEGDQVNFTEGAGRDGRPAAKAISLAGGAAAAHDEDME